MAFQKDGPFSWVYLAATFASAFTVIGLADSTGVIVAILVEQFKESNAKGGWIGSLTFFLVLALSPLVIYTHDRVGFRWCMVISSFLYAVSFLVTPFMPNLNLVFLSYPIPFGIAVSFLGTLSVTTQRIYFDKYYGLAVGVRFSGNSSGAILLSYLIPIIFDSLGHKKLFLSMLGFTPLFLCYGLVSRSAATETLRRANTPSRPVRKKMSILYREFFQDRSLVVCFIATCIYFTTAWIPIIFIVRYGVTLGYPLSKAKWLLMVRNIITLPARLIAGRGGDIALKRGKVKLVAQISYLTFGVIFLLCSFVRSFYILMVLMGLSGAVEGVFWVTFSLYVVEITGGYYSDEAFGLFSLMGAFSTLLGPPALGWVFDQTGDFRYVFYAIFAASSLSAFLLTLSSHVNVDKQLSLVEKGKRRKSLFQNGELLEGSLEPTVKGGINTNCSPLLYETTV